MSSILLVGSDPEFICKDANENFVSVIPYISGTKQEPLKTQHGAIQHDNVLAEINTLPSRTASTFSRNVAATKEDLAVHLNRYGAKITRDASAYYPPDQLASEEAMEFGCDRDYDAFDPSNPCTVPRKTVDPSFRTAGGHVHIGHPIAKQYPEIVVLACDLYLGLPSVLLDSNIERRSLYGQASRFRRKNYGVEYRTLSNFWVFSDVLRNWVFNTVQQVVNNPYVIFELENVVSLVDIRSIINNSDSKSASKAIRELRASGLKLKIPGSSLEDERIFIREPRNIGAR
jgi:hypothetical protein